MFFNKKKLMIATLSLAVGCSFGFNSYAFANAETTTVEETTKKKTLSQEELRQVEILKDAIKQNVKVYNNYVEKRKEQVREEINQNTSQHQNTIKTYKLKIASYMSLRGLSKSDKQNVIFYRNMIQKEKEQLNEENAQLRKKAENDMLKAKDSMDRKNAEIKDKLKTILGDSADSVIKVIDDQNNIAGLDDIENSALE